MVWLFGSVAVTGTPTLAPLAAFSATVRFSRWLGNAGGSLVTAYAVAALSRFPVLAASSYVTSALIW